MLAMHYMGKVKMGYKVLLETIEKFRGKCF